MTEFIKISSDMVQYSIDNSEKVNESFASLLLNPNVTWAKFILTDDEPNGNKVRIPKEEFSNIINSGIHMPIKMTLGKIEGHEASVPIGVITHLKEVGNRIEGLAALWNSERPEDIGLLKEKKEKDETLNISWEIGYTMTSDSQKYEGVMDLYHTVLKAATLVETPAYEGRTTILALAEMEKKNMEEKELQIKELEKSLTGLQEEKEELLEKLENSIASVEELSTEIAELKEFKVEVEAERERAEKMADIKLQFTEAGIEKGDEYFVENSETLLAMDEAALKFLIAEVLAFGKEIEEAKKSAELEEREKTLPPILGDEEAELDASKLANFLKFGKDKE